METQTNSSIIIQPTSISSEINTSYLTETSTTAEISAITSSSISTETTTQIQKLAELISALNIASNSTYGINLFSTNASLVTQLFDSSYDLNSCLIQCSYNGICVVNKLKNNFECNCFNGYTGGACEISINPCVPNSPCLNNGTCVYSPNSTSLYKCECNFKRYYGDNCEFELDLCSNATCINRGTCKVDESTFMPYCKCLQYFSGDKCEVMSNDLVTINKVVSIAIATSIVTIVIFYSTFLINDLIDFSFKIKIKPKKKPKLKTKY